MTASTARVRPVLMDSGRQLGLLWGGMVLLVLAALPFSKVLLTQVPACPFLGWTGIPCATCGATTAAVALGRGDFAAAFHASPLAAAGCIVFMLGGLVAGTAALRGKGVPEFPRQISWSARLVIGGTVLANWAYLIFLR